MIVRKNILPNISPQVPHSIRKRQTKRTHRHRHRHRHQSKLLNLSQISFIRHTFAALAVNEFQGLDIPCPPPGTGCVASGDAVLSKLSLDSVSVGKAVSIEVDPPSFRLP